MTSVEQTTSVTVLGHSHLRFHEFVGQTPADILRDLECQKEGESGWAGTKFMALFCVMSVIVASLCFIAFAGVLMGILGPALSEVHTVAISLHFICYIILVTVGLLSVYGIAKEKRSFQSSYCAALVGHIFFAIGSGAFCLAILFNPLPGKQGLDQLNSCLAIKHTIATHFCKRDMVAKGTALSLFLGMWCLEALSFYAVNRFVMDLDVRQKDKSKERAAGDEWDAYYC
ncbi:hypothetical protein CC1G_06526 [Coprinopsis cinerea okayama7|uniref:MARVEL domain-containing protein n=1 Tax=Coprinopsis cinerea (strain Okayama-7 / 130 / ATCC MYA-4618 / FGSC 9003) TaxID=240176 RepID=A8NNF6_COPC7|nr:hypothetical protein CC1G_06526 [Coprinopsis cinerea okayama7\|eukprot:XP_001835123.1 hypothetical protein CC1G_06526 [Coprinopsis cinerea okayama7\